MENPPSNTTSPWVMRLIIVGFIALAFLPVSIIPLKREVRRWQAAAAALEINQRQYAEASPAEIEESLGKLREIVVADPTDITLAKLLAKTYRSLDRPNDAIEIYDRLIADIESASAGPPMTEPGAKDAEATEETPIDPTAMPSTWWEFMMLRNAALHQAGRFRELAEQTTVVTTPLEENAARLAEAANSIVATDAIRASAYSNLASLYNTRAYARALGKFELDEGTDDINKALQYQSRASQLTNAAPAKALDSLNGEAMMLDTRGYLLYQRGEPGDDEAALDDFNAAIELLKENPITWEEFFYAQRSTVARVKELETQFLAIEESIAVIYNHRGLVHERLGNTKEAEADFQVVRDLGLQPGPDLN
ncbi:MAG: hypothetical protein NXI22_14695 [bacterium]|nr:hypothetical protein [bacterium]